MIARITRIEGVSKLSVVGYLSCLPEAGYAMVVFYDSKDGPQFLRTSTVQNVSRMFDGEKNKTYDIVKTRNSVYRVDELVPEVVFEGVNNVFGE